MMEFGRDSKKVITDARKSAVSIFRLTKNCAPINPDVAKVFHTEDAVSGGLRSLMNVTQESIGLAKLQCTRENSSC